MSVVPEEVRRWHQIPGLGVTGHCKQPGMDVRNLPQVF